MKESKKITYSAACTAIAAVCLLLSRYSPLKIMPLMVVAICFFIAMRCGLMHGLLTVAAALLLTLFWTGVDLTMLLTLLLFTPYSIAAFFIRRLSYKSVKTALVRGSIAVIIFNIALAVIVFVFADILGKLFFGITIDDIASKMGGITRAYIILAALGSLFSLGFDIMFVMADGVISARLRLPN